MKIKYTFNGVSHVLNTSSDARQDIAFEVANVINRRLMGKARAADVSYVDLSHSCKGASVYCFRAAIVIRGLPFVSRHCEYFDIIF